MKASRVRVAAGSPPAGAWERAAALREIRLDGRNTTVTVSVRWMGLFVVHGTFDDVQGTVRIPDGDVSRAQVHVDVGAASVRTGIGLRDRHLRSEAFLAAARHPAINFRTGAVVPDRPRLHLRGLATVRGVTAAARLACVASEPDRGALLVVGTATLSRRSFGVGCPDGLALLNPLYWLIADRVAVRFAVRVGPA